MSEQINVDHAFDPEVRKAQAELDAYMDSRPHQDSGGKVHHPENGQFINTDSYFNEVREEHEAATMPKSLDQLSGRELVAKYVDAEAHEDSTTMGDIEDVIHEPLKQMTVNELVTHYVDSKERGDSKVTEFIEDAIEDMAAEKTASILARPAEGNETLTEKDADEAGTSFIDGFFAQVEKRQAKNAEAAQSSQVEEEVSNDEKGHADVDSEDGSHADAEEARSDDVAEDRSLESDEVSDDVVEWMNGGTKPASRKEYEITTDPDRAARQARKNDQSLDSFGSTEGGWLVEKEDGAPKPPVDKDPVDGAPDPGTPDDEPVPPSDPQPPVDPNQPTERVPRTPGERDRQPRNWKKRIGRAALALLALVPAGYVAGRLHENYIVKAHDTPSVDEINQFEDHTRDVDAGIQENMVRNFDQAADFFNEKDGIGTAEGKENFGNLQEMFEKSKARLRKTSGGAMSEKRIAEVAEKEVNAQLAALAAHNASVKTTSTGK